MLSTGWRHHYYWSALVARALLTYLIFIDVAYNAKLLNLSDAFKQLHQLNLSQTTLNSPHNNQHRRSARSANYLAPVKSEQSGSETTPSSTNNNEEFHVVNDQPAAGQQQQQQQDQCCACDEAKYELVFEGLWSRYTHPDDFPENYWLAHFSDIIGASHSNEFRMWDQDALATDGVRELAETGSTKKLEAELKQVSSKTRTIIKARELRYPLLNGKTSAVFRTDRQHHLVSILSKLNPSPDWILGVSGLELCQSDCSWASQRVVNLYLWDAGTDSGTSFTAPDLPTQPQERIHAHKKESTSRARVANATSTQELPPPPPPVDSGVYLRRRSPDFMTYSDSSVVNPNGPAESTTAPPFTAGSSYPTKPYARLTITRQRIYEKSCTAEPVSSSVANNRNKQQNGNGNGNQTSMASLNGGHSSMSMSMSSGGGGGGGSISNPIEWAETTMSSQVDCRYTDWSDWSTCSSNCGRGIRTRTRGFVDDQQAHQSACSQTNLIEKEICLSECVGNVTCVTRDWSEWSRCSVTCGQGIRKRTRSPIGQMRKACGRIELSQTEVCIASHNVDCGLPAAEPDASNCEVSDWSQWSKCSVACGKGTRIRTRQYLQRKDGNPVLLASCNTTLIQKASCTGRLESCSDTTPVGNSRTTTNDSPQKAPQQQQQQPQNPNLPVIDCKLSSWSPWSTCSALCGTEAKRTRSRYIIQMPQNGGKPCDKRQLSRTQKCKDLPPCPPNYPLTSSSSSSLAV